MSLVVDFSRPATGKERSSLQKRLTRIERPGLINQIDRVVQLTGQQGIGSDLVLRNAFAYQDPKLGGEGSDRNAPPRAQRPSATRIGSSRGGTVRFELAMLALAQRARKPGGKARLVEFGYSVKGSRSETGWADFLVSDAEDSAAARNFINSRDKRARSVRSVLTALAEAGLVYLEDRPNGGKNYESFVLLNEGGNRSIAENEEYRVPRKSEETFSMPAGLVDNGWMHVLEDSELAMLMMIACGKGGWSDNQHLVIPADVRLRGYGIHRDSFSSARKTLEWFGLIDVEEVERHDDGRTERSDRHVHRLKLVESGFDKPAIETMTTVLTQQLQRP